MTKYECKNNGETRACFCIGPQNGDKYCPCKMRAIRREQSELKRSNEMLIKSVCGDTPRI